MSRQTIMFPKINSLFRRNISSRFLSAALIHPHIIFRHIQPDYPNGLYSPKVASRYPQIAAESNQALAKRIFQALEAYLTEAVIELDPEMKKHARTIVSLASPEGCWQTPNPIEYHNFLKEILEPLVLLCADLPPWMHFNLGSLGVEPVSDSYERFPQIVSDQAIGPMGLPLWKELDFNAMYGDKRRCMMNVALYGECGKGVVDYYTKRGLFHADPHIRKYEQVVALHKPSIIRFELEQQSFAKQLIICADYAADKQRKEFQRFFAMNPSMTPSALLGYTDISSAGKFAETGVPSFTTISVNDFTRHFSSVSRITQQKLAGIALPWATLENTPYTERQCSSTVTQYWPLSGKVRTYERVQFGDISDAVKEIDFAASSSHAPKPK